MSIHKSLTLDRVMDAVGEYHSGLTNPGFCIACGEDADGCEPDARNYVCDCCGESKVFGAEELLLMVSA